MADTHRNEESVWSQWHTRRQRARAKLKALQLMATSGVIRPIHVEFRYDITAEQPAVYSETTHDPDHALVHSTTSVRGSGSWQTVNFPFVQRLRDISEGILRTQRRLLAELQWGPDKA